MDTKPRMPSVARKKLSKPAGASGVYDHKHTNSVSLIGSIIAIDSRRAGSLVVTLRCGSLPDRYITGSNRQRKWTSRFLIRLTGPLAKKWRGILLTEDGRPMPTGIFQIEASLIGTADVIDGEDWLSLELVASDMRYIARTGIVMSSEDEAFYFYPTVETERAPELKSEPKKDKPGTQLPQDNRADSDDEEENPDDGITATANPAQVKEA